MHFQWPKGIVFGFLAAKTWHKARLAKFFASERERYLTSHRNWAIRSYSQILAPVLYRYWYTALAAFNWYPVPKPLKFGEVCNSDDTCPDYYRWLDSLHCWTYWLSSLLIAEVIVLYLPPLGGHKHPAATAVDGESAPLFETDKLPKGGSEEASLTEQDGNRTANQGLAMSELDELDPIQNQSSPCAINFIGIALAIIMHPLQGCYFSARLSRWLACTMYARPILPWLRAVFSSQDPYPCGAHVSTRFNNVLINQI